MSASLMLLASTSVAPAMAQGFTFQSIGGGAVRDGQLPTSAVVTHPLGVALDAQGNLYIAQFFENRIRKVSADRTVITTVAGNGNGKWGFSGDGGAASGATLNRPAGLAVDSAGNVFIADSGNSRVRRIAANGVITTVAGNGVKGNAGDGGAAINASLTAPYGLALDAAGNLYISDWQAHVVRKVTPGGTISTVAGNGTAGFSGDGGAATSANLYAPEGLSLDAAGNLYIADTNNHRIRMVTLGGVISTVVGNGMPDSYGDGGPATSASIFYPYNVVVDPYGGLLVADSYCLIRRVESGVINAYAGNGSCEYSGDGGSAFMAGFGTPEGMAFDALGNLYFADAEFGRVRQIRALDHAMGTVAGSGTFAGDGGLARDAVLSRPYGIAADRNGNVYVADSIYNRRVRKLSVNGTLDTVAGNGGWHVGSGSIPSPTVPATTVGLSRVKGMAMDGAGNLYLADRQANRVFKVSSDGYISTYAGTGSSTYGGEGVLAIYTGMDPAAVALDASGNLYFADASNHRVRKVTPAGVVTTVAGNGTAAFSGDGGPGTSASLNLPNTLAIDAKGNLFIGDYYNRRVRKLATNGTITTVAGNGVLGTGGDGGAATSAELASISGLAVDAGDTLYIAAGGSLRRVTPGGIIESVPGWAYGAMDVAFDASGRLHVATDSGRVIRGLRQRGVAYDFNGDRVADVVWRNGSTGANVIWRSANSAAQQGVSGVTGVDWKVAGIGDFDGDGKSDLFWRNTATGSQAIWRGGNSSTRMTVASRTDLNWKIAAIADFSGDGFADVLWRNTSTGANEIWQAGSETSKQAVVGVTDQNWVVAGAGDFDGNGKADILWRNTSNGANTVWLSANNATQQATTSTTTAWTAVGIGDFDGDGKADILWRNAAGANVIWKSGRSTTAQAVTAVTNPNWMVAAVADYNGDGQADLLWHDGTTGTSVIWKSGQSSTTQGMTTITNTDWKILD